MDPRARGAVRSTGGAARTLGALPALSGQSPALGAGDRGLGGRERGAVLHGGRRLCDLERLDPARARLRGVPEPQRRAGVRADPATSRGCPAKEPAIAVLAARRFGAAAPAGGQRGAAVLGGPRRRTPRELRAVLEARRLGVAA